MFSFVIAIIIDSMIRAKLEKKPMFVNSKGNYDVKPVYSNEILNERISSHNIKNEKEISFIFDDEEID